MTLSKKPAELPKPSQKKVAKHMGFGVVVFLTISFITWANAVRRRDGSFFNSTVDVICLAILLFLSSVGIKVETADVVAVLVILGLDLGVVLVFR